MQNYRKDEIGKRLEKFGYDTLEILLVGSTGSGKSTTINSFIDKEVAKVGRGTEPETMDIKSYLMDNFIQIWDTPGLGDSPEADVIHSKKIIEELQARVSEHSCIRFIDMVIILVEAGMRDMGTVFSLIKNTIIPNMKEHKRIIVALNQADFAMKGQNFDYTNNEPNETLKNFLEDKKKSVKRRLKEVTGYNIKVIYYSAETGYNVDCLLDAIIDNIPENLRCI